MTYRRNYRNAKPTPRNMQAKFGGLCICCRAEIKAGEWCTYYPAGILKSGAAIGHIGGLEGTGQRCFVEQVKQREQRDAGFVDLDRAYEDQCADICGR
jgi:hypothetical protein